MSNLYIRVKTSFYTHRKTIKLKLAIGDSAYWIPPRIWAYAAENQPDGDLSGYSSEELALLIGCSSNAQAMLGALKDAGFIDDDGFIHDWDDHNSYHKSFSERAKVAAKARWEGRTKEKPPTPPKEETGNRIVDSGDKHCSSNAPSIKVFKKPTIDEILLQCAKIGLPDAEGQKFFNHFESNGWKVGGKAAMKSWTAALQTWKSRWDERRGQTLPQKQNVFIADQTWSAV